jgi:hypothetical protein
VLAGGVAAPVGLRPRAPEAARRPRPRPAGSLDSALARALDLEASNRPREAAALFRRVLAGDAAGAARGGAAGDGSTPGATEDPRVVALLGAERVYAEMAQTDSVPPLVAPLVRLRPADPVVRTVQLRSLLALQRRDEARAAYRAWRRAAPGDPAPFREFARLLIAAGQRAAADSVLADASGGGSGLAGAAGRRALAPERAQLLAASGAWAASAGAWREAVSDGGLYEPAAVFSLQASPDSVRTAVGAALLAPPAVPPARRIAAQALLIWRRPREAWAALAALPPDSAARAAWREAAGQLAAAEAWGAARDAWTRVFDTGAARHRDRRGPPGRRRGARRRRPGGRARPRRPRRRAARRVPTRSSPSSACAR